MTPSERLEQLEEGDSPKLILRMKSGFAVMGDTQWLPGYALLLAHPLVSQLNDLCEPERSRFLAEMAILGDAVREATDCKRVNYGIYGNLDPFLHVHVWPRYEWEDRALATMPPFAYPSQVREAAENQFDPEKHGLIQNAIRTYLLSKFQEENFGAW